MALGAPVLHWHGIHMKAATAGQPALAAVPGDSVNHQAKLNRRGTRAGRAFNPVPKFNHGPFKLLVDSESRTHGPKLGLLI